ncbi:hypothetical protein LIS04_87 [Listeria phage LIS04]|nr:hypothetical protein LIS04_87 [Listeria phage LIS04]
MSECKEGCTTHFIGEIVPVMIELTSESDTDFEVLPQGATCEVRTLEGELLATHQVRAESISGNTKKLFFSWDTTKLDVGYYMLRFWVSINLFGAKAEGSGELVEEARIVSSELKKYLKRAE